MNVAEAKLFLEQFTYKPGWHIEVLEPLDPNDVPGRVLLVRIRTEAIDAYHPDQKTWFHGMFDVRDWMLDRPDTATFLAEQMRFQIRDMELHEMDEFLRWGGRIMCDPHDPEVRSAKTQIKEFFA